MFHSSYTPEYFSLKQLKQLRDYNTSIHELYYKNIVNNNNIQSKFSCVGGMCNVL